MTDKEKIKQLIDGVDCDDAIVSMARKGPMWVYSFSIDKDHCATLILDRPLTEDD